MPPQRARFLVATALSALLFGLTPSAVPSVRGADSLPPGFTETTYVSGFGHRLTAMAWAPDGRLFVSEKGGALRVVKNRTLLTTAFLTVPVSTSSERGLVGLAFDPNFVTNRYVYVFYTHATSLKNRVSRFTASTSNPDVAASGSELVLLDNIPSDSGVHNGGALHFGPDGKLYIAVGDSGTGSNAQNLGVLPGKILRLNANGSIPSDNPFVGQTGRRGEIWAYGLRNPYTFAFQSGSGRMFINDVGQSTWEEVNEGARGANFGWPTCEGPCSNSNFVNPVYAYRHADGPGKAITGAVFYSGTSFPAEYRNDYFFGDYVGQYIKRYDMETRQVVDFATGVSYPVDLDVGPDGALYYASVEGRRVSRIAYGGTGEPPPGSGQVTLAPTADNHTTSSQPDRNFGRSPLLYVKSASPTDNAFLKWNLSSLAGKRVRSATLALRTSSEQWAGSAATQNFRLVENTSWTELGLTHNNKPAMSTLLGSLSNSVPGTAYQVTLSAAAIQPKLGQQLSIGVESVGVNDNMYFHSRENSSAQPALVITYDDEAPPPVGQPPQPQIATPQAGTTYRAGNVLNYSGSATDPEDGALPASRLTWEVLFHHDTHTHPFVEPYSGSSSGTFTIPDTGETSHNVWYRILLTATDSDGNRVTVQRDVVPLKATVTLATVPAGLTLLLDGQPSVAPFSFTGVQRFKRELTAPATQSLNGKTYQYQSWSDGAAAQHVYVTPDANATKTATYVEVVTPSTTLAADTFGRTVSNGWGSATTGGAYTLEGSAANFSVGGGVGSMVLPATGATRATLLPAVSARDVDITFRVRSDKAAVGGAQYVYGVVRRNSNNAYRPKIILKTNGTVAVHAGQVVNNSESSVAPSVTVPGLTHTANSFIWVRAQVTGASPTTIRVKAWADGQAEPSAWHFSATNSNSALQTAGAVGLRAYISSTNVPITFSFDDFSVRSLP